MRFKRPVEESFPISAEYGKWGPYWSRYIGSTGQWLRGQLNGLGQHKGVDFACPEGTIIKAMYDGIVVMSGWENPKDIKQGFGMRIRQQIITENGQVMTLVYGHLYMSHVLPGHQVVAGDGIGLSGNTGHTSGPHLHVELVDAHGQYHPMEFEPQDEKPTEIA